MTHRPMDYKRIVIYGSVFVASIGLIGLSHTQTGLMEALLKECGIAGLVALVVALTVEQLSQEEFKKLALDERNAIKRDVFHYVYGRNIPEEITKEIDTQILETDFVRNKLMTHFLLDPFEHDGERYLLNDCTISYQVQNIAADDRTFPLKHAIDKPPLAALSDRVKYVSLNVKDCKSPIEWDEDQLKNRHIRSETEITLDLPKEIVVEKGRSATVELKYTAVRNLKGGRIDYNLTSHASGIEVVVHVPKGGLQVSADAYSPYRPTPTGRHVPKNGYHNWTIDRPLLPYQGVYITWWEIPAPTPSQTS